MVFNLLLILAVTALFTLVFAFGFRNQRNKILLFMYYVILFLATWAGSVWVAPENFPAWGGFWLPLVAIGFLFALLLAAFIPPSVPPLTEREAAQRPEPGRLGFDVLLYILLVTLIAAIAVSIF